MGGMHFKKPLSEFSPVYANPTSLNKEGRMMDVGDGVSIKTQRAMGNHLSIFCELMSMTKITKLKEKAQNREERSCWDLDLPGGRSPKEKKKLDNQVATIF